MMIKSPISHHESHITSHISPFLIQLVYPLTTKLIFPFFFKEITIIGKENVPKNGGLIIAPTHRSRWDALIVPYATGKLVSGRNPHFMVSANEMKGIQGWVIRSLGGFPVNTDKPGLDSLRHSFDLLCQEEMVVIFPEGNIFRTDEVQPLKRGVAKIALEVEITNPEVEVKILPVSIKYSQPIPSRGCSVTVTLGECLKVREYQGKSTRENSLILTADLTKSLQKIHEN
ncbi:lysophospholipid acyltransferase family protein [Geminocystis sp.]|uniref:lysophospholipid acyltransferase family protein n=1 Tax=Geminocystis sp. TaxID=2664100 RepID=UPI003593C3CB